jgi:hypothetical protein
MSCTAASIAVGRHVIGLQHIGVSAFRIVRDYLKAIPDEPKCRHRAEGLLTRSVVEAELLGSGNAANMAHKLFGRGTQFDIVGDKRELRPSPATG